MRALSSGGADVPLRTVMKLPGGRNFFGVMPGYLSEPQGLGTKIITIFPDNAKLGLSSHVGLVLLFDSEIGFPLAVMDAGEVTAIRTAAASAVATRALARARCIASRHSRDGRAGYYAPGINLAGANVAVDSGMGTLTRQGGGVRTGAGRAVGIEIETSRSAEEAVRSADIVCTVTASREPILNGAWLQKGAHVNLVGSSQQTAREADDEVVTVSRFFVDSRVSARAEAGELKHAMEAGLVSESHVLGEIGEVLNGKVVGRTHSHDITVYKSLGVAAQDMAAARVIYDRATRDGIGMSVPFYGH